jgi:hypothetical protein
MDLFKVPRAAIREAGSVPGWICIGADAPETGVVEPTR